MFGFAKRLLTFLAATADLQRFGRWKNYLEDALEKLEKDYKNKKISKKGYTQQKVVLKEKLKKAEELIKKSKERLEESKHREIRI